MVLKLSLKWKSDSLGGRIRMVPCNLGYRCVFQAVVQNMIAR